MCGGTPVIPALRMQKEENHKFKHILDYIVRPCQRREDTKWYKEDRRFFHEIVIEKNVPADFAVVLQNANVTATVLSRVISMIGKG